MRGVYKVPGGKLVTVELDQIDGRIAHAVVAGDFFLEPDEALTRITAGVNGLAITASAVDIAQAISANLDPQDHLIGFDPHDVGLAVRRAVGAATSWDDHTFELITDVARDPYTQMALDQVFAEALADGSRGPTLRFWDWASSAVVIGSFQSLANEVDLEAAARRGVTVVRRVSGGGAMFIEPGNTITYSLVVPATLVDSMSFEQSYEFLDAWVVAALRDLGIQATYQPINDITSPAGKIAGAAQKRWVDGTVLHHVTMAYDIDAVAMMDVLRIGREKMSDKGTTSAAKRVDPLRSQTHLSRGQIVAALTRSFAQRHGLTVSAVRVTEEQRAAELVATTFATPAWLTRIP
ncbi:MAG: lipoate--protein ligase family protein [Propionibacteriaceae bacterium]|nr:lipoate--protein ligase family protein [Propionibacteriaceae bacterium]